MSDYLVGKKSVGGKDRYVVGWQEGKQASYKVGGGSKASPAESDNKELGGTDQASPTGQKSAFKYNTPDTTNKNDGSDSENINFGGSISNGMPMDNLNLKYTEKGDWDMNKNAMSKRKERMEAADKYLGKNSQFDSPTVDIIDVKKV